ncbi:hypothetical protein [Blattabacterium cuenoti]|uniref:hypothetical protein n=1 Tax=Blattabacterium cuenoti TaxID=1653831 RepID=UPI001EEB8C9E|nr:hypothetical protein [Blattabacterium cuenoti]
MQFQKQIFFEKIIKNGKYLFSYPVLCVFLLETEKQNLSINLVGTLVKKKI